MRFLYEIDNETPFESTKNDPKNKYSVNFLYHDRFFFRELIMYIKFNLRLRQEFDWNHIRGRVHSEWSSSEYETLYFIFHYCDE